MIGLAELSVSSSKMCRIAGMLFLVLVVVFVTSCYTGFGVSKKKLLPINRDFSGSFYNASSEGLLYGQVHLTNLLNVHDSVAMDVIHISFLDSTHLLITYTDSAANETALSWDPENLNANHRIITGRFYKTKFFTTSWSDGETRVPFFWYDRAYVRLRIGIMKDKRLVIDYYLQETNKSFGSEHETETNSTYYFKPVERELLPVSDKLQ